MGTYSAYIHTAPNNKKYIGITKNAPTWRWRNGTGYSRCPFGRAVRKYGWDNIKHGIFAQGLTLNEAEEMEIALISFYDTTNPAHGYNISYGGHVGLRDPSPEFKERLRLANTGANNPRSIPIRCVQTGEVFESLNLAARKLNLKLTGIKRVLSGRNKQTKGLSFEYVREEDRKEKTKTLSKEEVAAIFRKPVAVYSKDGTLVAIYKSRAEAAAELNISASRISDCIHGYKKPKSVDGYYFKDVSGKPYERKAIPHPGNAGAKNGSARSIYCYTKQGEFVKHYSYATLAAKELDCDLSSIIKSCKGKLQSVKGYVFRYS